MRRIGQSGAPPSGRLGSQNVGVRRQCSFLLILLLAVPSLVGSGVGTAGSKSKIADGFTVADGSRLLGGTAFPVLDSQWLDGAKSGWVATLDVFGPAASVYDAYAGQAHSLGYAVEWSDNACANISGTDVYCSGAVFGLSLDVRVCASCSPPVSSGTLMQIGKASDGEVAVGEMPSDREPTFDLQLDAAQRAATRSALPRVGQLLVPSPFSVIRMLPGSRAVAYGNQCLSAAVVVAPKNAVAIYRNYVKQIPHEVPIRTAQGRINGTPAREAVGDWGAVRMVERKSSSVLAISECTDT